MTRSNIGRINPLIQCKKGLCNLAGGCNQGGYGGQEQGPEGLVAYGGQNGP